MRVVGRSCVVVRTGWGLWWWWGPYGVRRAPLKIIGLPVGVSKKIGNRGGRVSVENQKGGGRLQRAKE